jgi:hypothetical protein
VSDARLVEPRTRRGKVAVLHRLPAFLWAVALVFCPAPASISSSASLCFCRTSPLNQSFSFLILVWEKVFSKVWVPGLAGACLLLLHPPDRYRSIVVCLSSRLGSSALELENPRRRTLFSTVFSKVSGWDFFSSSSEKRWEWARAISRGWCGPALVSANLRR